VKIFCRIFPEIFPGKKCTKNWLLERKLIKVMNNDGRRLNVVKPVIQRRHRRQSAIQKPDDNSISSSSNNNKKKTKKRKLVFVSSMYGFFVSVFCRCHPMLQSGLPDGMISYKKSHFGQILEGQKIENVGIFYAHLEYLIAIRHFNGRLLEFAAIWYVFFTFWYFASRKIWQPWLQYDFCLFD
jgi:hypothetical protein